MSLSKGSDVVESLIDQGVGLRTLDLGCKRQR
jgi:hypothetical protein